MYNTEGIEEHKLMNERKKKKKKEKKKIDNALIAHIPGIHTWLAASRQPEWASGMRVLLHTYFGKNNWKNDNNKKYTVPDDNDNV